jgi:phosphoserine phosphatase
MTLTQTTQKHLILIRHGESIANHQKRYQGQSFDTDLTSRGHLQAKALAAAIADQKKYRVFASPLKRTLQTAAPLSPPILPEPLLLEINHGTWEGKQVEEFDLLERRVLTTWQTAPHRTQMIEGEHFADVVDRCQQFLAKASALKGSSIAVTHDVIIRIIIAQAAGLPFSRIWDLAVANAGIHVVSLNPLALLKTNQVTHLGSMYISSQQQAL